MGDEDFLMKIGILTVPTLKSGNTPLSNLVRIAAQGSDFIVLITGNEGYLLFKNDPRVTCYGITTPVYHNPIKKILCYIYVQLKQSYLLVKTSRDIDLWIFFLGEEQQILPIICAKLWRKKVIVSSSGSRIQCAQSSQDSFLNIIILFSKITTFFADALILYSKKFIIELKLQKFANKIFIAHENFVDCDTFKRTRNLNQRKNIIGYIGRLSLEKGVLNFLHAIPDIQKVNPSLRFYIIGEGVLKEDINLFIQQYNLGEYVTVYDWIDHSQMPDILNTIKLLVIPSYTEGLPNILLEAMASGTPVLATPVGAIPEIIDHGKNSFLLSDNSPDEITKRVIEIVQYNNLDDISDAAMERVTDRYSFEYTSEEYWKIIQSVLS